MNKNLKKLVTLVATVGIVASQSTGVMASDLQMFSDSNVSLANATEELTTTDGNWTYRIENNNVYLIKYTGSSSKVIIPDEINGTKVIDISRGLFKDSKNTITSITLGKNICIFDSHYTDGMGSKGLQPGSYFSDYSFKDLNEIIVDDSNPYYYSKDGMLLSKDKKTLYAAVRNKESITVPATVTTIGVQCFWQSNMKTISLNSNLEVIKSEAFGACDHIKEIVIPDNVKTIEDFAFLNSEGFESVKIGKGTSSITAKAFYGCEGIKEIKVDENNQKYESNLGVLYSKGGSILVYCPANYEEGGALYLFKASAIGPYAFSYSHLDEVVMKNDTITGIGEFAFSSSKITKVSLSNNITSIPKSAFQYSKLKEISVPRKVTNIGERAFDSCDELSKIEIPDSVKTIGDSALHGCFKLNCITIPEKFIDLDEDDIGIVLHAVTFKDEEGAILSKDIVPNGKAALFSGKIPTKDGYTFIEWSDTLSSITKSIDVTPVFVENPKKVTFVDENNKVITTESIEKGKSAIAPEIPKKIGYSASWDKDFSNVQSDLTIKVKYSPLYKTEAVDGGLCLTDYLGTEKDVVIPEEIDGKKVVKLDKTFKNNTTIQSVTMPDTITNITGNTFCHCKILTKIELSDNIKTLETFAIYECKNLNKIILPANLETLKSCAIIMVPNIAEIALPNRLKTIEKYAFDQCPKLESISIPSSVKEIKDNAFANLSGLKRFFISDYGNNIEIGSDILLNCNVESIDVPKEYIGKVNFGGNVNTVIFKDADGTILNSQLVLTGKDASEPSKPSKEGFEFTGWSKEFNNVTGNLEVIAQYTAKITEIKNYTVTFKDMNGNIIDKQTVKEGLAASAPDAPKVEGYTFKSWDADYFNIKKDTIINAKYEKNPEKYAVIFKDYDGKILDTQEVEEGSSAKEIVKPEREGYTFIGWDKSFDQITEDLVVTAKYEENAKEEPSKDEKDATVTPSQDETKKEETQIQEQDKNKSDGTATPASEEQEKDDDKTSSDVEGSTDGASSTVDKGQTPTDSTDKDQGSETQIPSDSVNPGSETEKPTDGTQGKDGDITGFGAVGSLFVGLCTMIGIMKKKK